MEPTKNNEVFVPHVLFEEVIFGTRYLYCCDGNHHLFDPSFCEHCCVSYKEYYCLKTYNLHSVMAHRFMDYVEKRNSLHKLVFTKNTPVIKSKSHGDILLQEVQKTIVTMSGIQTILAQSPEFSSLVNMIEMLNERLRDTIIECVDFTPEGTVNAFGVIEDSCQRFQKNTAVK